MTCDLLIDHTDAQVTPNWPYLLLKPEVKANRVYRFSSYLSIVEINRLMLFREIIYAENITKQMNMPWEKSECIHITTVVHVVITVIYMAKYGVAMLWNKAT